MEMVQENCRYYIDEVCPGGCCAMWKLDDFYWKNTLNKDTSLGTPKYPTLEKLVRAVLTPSFGWAHVKRDVSLNKLVTALRVA